MSRLLKGNRWRTAIIVTIAALIGLFTFSVIAVGDTDPQAETETADTEILREMTGGFISFKRVRTQDAAQIFPSTVAANTFATITTILVPVTAGRTALINARWHGETVCTEGDTDPNWCSMRILIGGVEGHPQSGLDFAIDSHDQGDESFGSWEGHGFERHRCLRNAGTTTINVPVTLQWAVRNFPADATRPSFRIDDWSFVAERSDNCSPLN